MLINDRLLHFNFHAYHFPSIGYVLRYWSSRWSVIDDLLLACCSGVPSLLAVLAAPHNCICPERFLDQLQTSVSITHRGFFFLAQSSQQSIDPLMAAGCATLLRTRARLSRHRATLELVGHLRPPDRNVEDGPSSTLYSMLHTVTREPSSLAVATFAARTNKRAPDRDTIVLFSYFLRPPRHCILHRKLSIH
jgi:hypothetical protein